MQPAAADAKQSRTLAYPSDQTWIQPTEPNDVTGQGAPAAEHHRQCVYPAEVAAGGGG